jgi:hypothetical protein
MPSKLSLRLACLLALCCALIATANAQAPALNASYDGESIRLNYPESWLVGANNPNHIVLTGDGIQIDVFASTATKERLNLETLLTRLAGGLTTQTLTLTPTTLDGREAYSTSFTERGINWHLLAVESQDGGVFFLRTFSVKDSLAEITSAVATSIMPTVAGVRTYVSPEGLVSFGQPLGYDVRAITPNTFIVANTPDIIPDAANASTPIAEGSVTYLVYTDIAELPAYTPEVADAEAALKSYLNPAVCAACNATFSDYSTLTLGERDGYDVQASFPAFDVRGIALNAPEGISVTAVYVAPNALDAHTAALDTLAQSVRRLTPDVPALATATTTTPDGYTVAYPEGWVVDRLGEAIRLRPNVGISADPQTLREGQVLMYIFPSVGVLEVATGYNAPSENTQPATIALYFTSQAGITGATAISDIDNGSYEGRALSNVSWLAPQGYAQQWVSIASEDGRDIYTFLVFARSETLSRLQNALFEMVTGFGR